MNANNSDAFDSVVDLLNNDYISDDEALWRAKALLKIHTNAVREADEWGLTLLHYAAQHRGPKLCKLLIGMSPDIVRTANNFGFLPVHISCRHNDNVETTKYLLYSYPESIIIADPDIQGYCPLHWFLVGRANNRAFRCTEQDLELLHFLLQNDRGAVSRPSITGALPLHMACEVFALAVVKSVYNSYPEAIFKQIQNDYRSTPLDIAREHNHHEVVSCLEIQLGYVQAGTI
eukprot:scaffold37533_cov24-Cyclotella_meneghiniana.AAC.1